jgi:hypothetical protein
MWATSGSDSLCKDFNYHSNGAEAEPPSRSGCHLCTLIFQSAWDPSKDIARCLTLEQSLTEVRGGKGLSLTVNMDLIDDCYCHSCTQGRVALADRKVRILLTTPGFHAWIVIEAMKSNNPSRFSPFCAVSTTSKECKDLMLKWVKDSADSHHNCKQASSTPPTRLLDVNIPNKPRHVRLVTTAREPPEDQYLARSYCWGDTEAVKLTKLNFDSMQSGILIDTLSQSIRDAISMTRMLGFRWL